MRFARLAFAALSFALAGGALAQQYPAKPVRIIVPFPPGQATDILARLLGDQLSKSLGQQFIAENRPGAGGAVATEAAAKAAPDGYTLVMATISTFGINPSLYPKLGYSPLRDFAPISNLGLTPQTLVASPKAGFGSLKEFVDKARSTELNYASSGNGSASHLSMELFRTASGAKLNHVPFKGNAEALTQVFARRDPDHVRRHPRRARADQVGEGEGARHRLAQALALPAGPPDHRRAGVSGFEAVGWIGIAAPARTPEPVLKTLQAAIAKALAEPDVQKRMGELAFVPVGDTPGEFTAFIKSENAKWAKAVKDSGAKVD